MFKSFGLIFIGFNGQFLALYGVICTLTTLDGAFTALVTLDPSRTPYQYSQKPLMARELHLGRLFVTVKCIVITCQYAP